MRLRLSSLAVVVGAIGAGAVGVAGPASADDITDNAVGVYSFRYKSRDSTVKWVATACDDNAPRCIKITKYDDDDAALQRPAWSGNAYWAVGSWTMVADVPGVRTCKDGSEYTLRTTYSWDAVSGVGWRSFFDPGLCGDDPDAKNREFVLTRTGPLPAPAPAG